MSWYQPPVATTLRYRVRSSVIQLYSSQGGLVSDRKHPGVLCRRCWDQTRELGLAQALGTISKQLTFTAGLQAMTGAGSRNIWGPTFPPLKDQNQQSVYFSSPDTFFFLTTEEIICGNQWEILLSIFI